MSAWLIHGTAIAGRALAGLFGCMCFYTAFFMYETEEGAWQNRLEALWFSVYDRAKVTESTTIAFFNKIATTLQKAVDYIFGPRAFSFRAFSVSFYLSLAVGILGYDLLVFYPLAKLANKIMTHYPNILSSRFFLVPQFLDFIDSYYRFILPTEHLVFRLLLPLTLILAAWATSKAKLKVIRILFSFPFVYTTLLIIAGSHMPAGAGEFLLIITLSALSDFVFLTAIRRLLTLAARTVSIGRMLVILGAFCTIGIVVLTAPLIVMTLWLGTSNSVTIRVVVHVDSLMSLLLSFNLITAIYCATPVLMMLALLIHRLAWPVTSRLTYPLVRNGFSANKKMLVGTGALLLTFALNLEHVGLKAILKLFS